MERSIFMGYFGEIKFIFTKKLRIEPMAVTVIVTKE